MIGLFVISIFLLNIFPVIPTIATVPIAKSHWDFEEGSGSIVDDSGTWNYTGHTDNTTWVPGIVDNHALLFIAADNGDEVRVGDHDDYSFTSSGQDQPFSVSAWINIQSYSTWPCIVGKNDNTDDNAEWVFQVTGDGYLRLLLLEKDENAYIEGRYDVPLSLNTSCFVCATYDGSEEATGISVYINGIDVTDTYQEIGSYDGMSNGNASLHIGSLEQDSCYFDGVIDDVKIFDEEISPTEVNSLYLYDFLYTTPLEPQWIQNMTSFGLWQQMNGDPNFDPDGDGRNYDFDIEIDSSLMLNCWTSRGYSTRTAFWASEAVVYRYAGCYQTEPLLQNDSWEFMTQLFFNPAYQGVSYSSVSGIEICIYNEFSNLMVLARIADNNSSLNGHELFGQIYYYTETGIQNLVIETTKEINNYDIDNGYFGLKINTSNNLYVYFPDQIPDGSNWRLVTAENNARARGSMTYIAITCYKRYEAPVDAHFSSLSFYYQNDNETTGTSQSGSNNSSDLQTDREIPFIPFIFNLPPELLLLACLMLSPIPLTVVVRRKKKKKKSNLVKTWTNQVEGTFRLNSISPSLSSIPPGQLKDNQTNISWLSENKETRINPPWYLVFLTPFMFLIKQILFPPQVRKLKHKQVLDNSIREKILYILKENEFEHFMGLKSQLKCGVSTLKWHLQVLEDFEYLNHTRIGQYSIYYLKNKPLDLYKVKLYCSIRSKAPLYLVKTFMRQTIQTYTLPELSKLLRKKELEISYLCKKLLNLGLIELFSYSKSYGLVQSKISYIKWLLQRFEMD